MYAGFALGLGVLETLKIHGDLSEDDSDITRHASSMKRKLPVELGWAPFKQNDRSSAAADREDGWVQ